MTRSNNKVLKIRAAKLDDTGTFVCRGVNGFGKAQVNIHLIVVGKSVLSLSFSQNLVKRCHRIAESKCAKKGPKLVFLEKNEP